jgi:hypothetical protein
MIQSPWSPTWAGGLHPHQLGETSLAALFNSAANRAAECARQTTAHGNLLCRNFDLRYLRPMSGLSFSGSPAFTDLSHPSISQMPSAVSTLARPRCGEPDGCCLRVDLLPAPVPPDKHARK